MALALGTAGCSSGADSKDVAATASTFTGAPTETATSSGEPSSLATRPSPGAVTSKDKSFNFVVPSGWNLTNNPKALAYLSSATMAHDVAPTIVVTLSDVKPAPDLDETVQMGMMQARQSGDSVTRTPNRSVGGAPSAGFQTEGTYKNVEVRRTYQIIKVGDKLYSVVLTAAKADAAAAANTLNGILASWTWSKAGDSDSTASGTTPAPVPSSTSSSSSSSPSSSGASSQPPKSITSTSAPSSATPTKTK